jgi:DNA-directed RNA polymerase subunit RPC12/RpoP
MTVSNAHKCFECGAEFATLPTLLRHADAHSKQAPGEQACHLCGERFARSRITAHLLQQHPDGKAAQLESSCALCAQKFR